MPRREHRHRSRSPPVPREDAHRSASSEFDSDDEEQRAPPLLKRNDGNSDDDSDEDMDEDSDEDSTRTTMLTAAALHARMLVFFCMVRINLHWNICWHATILSCAAFKVEGAPIIASID